MTRYTSHTIYTSHTRYTRSYMYEPHHLHKPYRIHKPHHRKRVPGRQLDMVDRHTVKMEKEGDTMRQKEQFYCVS